MQRAELEHLVRAAGAIAEADELVVIGSQAILASIDDPPADLLVSMEADLYPLPDVAKADLIDGSIGEESPFHETFGYYAHGIGPETATLPRGWEKRLVVLVGPATRGIKAYCLHPLDIAASKLAAGRQKDLDYVRTLKQEGLIDRDRLAQVLATEMTAPNGERLSRLFAGL